PLIDTLRGPRWGLRAWIVASQLLMGLMLVPLVLADDPFRPEGLGLLTLLLVAHAVFASTQDVSIDALAITTVPPEERGTINGFMQLGMLGARAAFGGIALYVEQFVGERVVLVALLACIWLSSLLVIFGLREPLRREGSAGGFVGKLRAMLKASSTWWAVAFALVAGAGFKATGAVAGPLLLSGGLDKEGVGLFFSTTAAALALGALGGGKLADLRGRHEAARLLLLGLAVAVGITAAASLLGGAVLVAALLALYVVAGAFTAAELALYMDATDPALGATQFSAYMGAINLCETWSSYSVGQLVPVTGYPSALRAMAVISLLGVVLLPRMVAASSERLAPAEG
ncbi:MAG: MFS transporter, partial [Myxococcales bacterium]|nr:MFS transporter [Myxococcales bacterium]